MTERYGIYYAPATLDPLWNRAAAWLGRDAADGACRPSPVIPGIDAERRRLLTVSARRYGFHGTLKPPMALAPGTTAEALAEALSAFCASRPSVAIGRLKVSLLGRFLALMPEVQGEALGAFAAECVIHFDSFRAPLSTEERARRLHGNLSDRQLELLDMYGYPYVIEQFRFHMTLTDALPDGDRDRVVAAAEAWFAPVLERHYVLDRLVVFREPDAGGLFMRGDEFLMGEAVPADG